MDFWGVFVIGIGLSMDAFAVSICKGLSMKKINVLHLILIAFSFAFFQFIMPVIGYYLCVQFEGYIISFDHWIAFILLGFIGGKMIFEACKKDEEVEIKAVENVDEKQLKKEGKKLQEKQKLDIKELLVLSVATSIDALAVGITFAFFDFNVFGAGAIIGVTTFVLCSIGILIGNFFGAKFKKPAEITGGVILILMGVKILLEHLGVLVL